MVVKKAKIKEKKIDIPHNVDKSKELVKMIKDFKLNKKLYFQIYDGLKGFDLIMSIVGKEEMVEYFVTYMKDSEVTSKNYSTFIEYISKKEGKEFIEKLVEIYNGILSQYDNIKFGKTTHHFGTEEIYLRETLNKIKTILEGFGKLNSKSNFIKFNLNFLNSKNASLDFKFNDAFLEQIQFYEKLDDLEEETSSTNLLPFFHLLNNLMGELEVNQERVKEMSEEFIQELTTNIESLENEYTKSEVEAISQAKKDVTTYLKKKDISLLTDIIDETENILQNLERNKNLPQSIVRKDIETLENSLEELERIL